MPHTASRRPTAVDRIARAKTMTIPIIVTLTIAVAAVAATPAQAAPTKTVRQMFVEKTGLPAAYMELKNPLPATAANIAKGAALYDKNCKSCHGAKGLGDGEASGYYDPPPTNLVEAGVTANKLSDAYLFWALSEGGKPIKVTGMDALKTKLAKDDLWALVLYIRGGLKSAKAK